MSGDFRYPELQDFALMLSPTPGGCLTYRIAEPISADLRALQQPITTCCAHRLVRLPDDERSDFTRDAFGVI